MSVFRVTEHYGYDGDCLHGHIRVYYWQDRDRIEAEIDRQFAEFRAAALADLPRLTEETSGETS